jgi:hypothetical protein
MGAYTGAGPVVTDAAGDVDPKEAVVAHNDTTTEPVTVSRTLRNQVTGHTPLLEQATLGRP